MTTLLTPRVSQLLDELFLAATAADAPILARMRALAPAARDDLLRDYRRLYGAAKEAYLAVSREVGVFLYTQARAALSGSSSVLMSVPPPLSRSAAANLERAGLADLVEIRVGDALDSLRALPGGIDLLYLDGAKTLYREVLARCEPHLRTGALIIADNIDMAALVAPYTTYVREPTNGYLSSRVVLGDGLEVSLRLA